MVNNILLAEQKLEQYLPILKEYYPKKRKNKEDLKNLINAYQEITFDDKVVIALFDDINASVIYLSDNFKKLAGYDVKTALGWGSFFLFKAIHFSHYSYPFTALKYRKRFFKRFKNQQTINLKAHCSGLKLMNGEGKVRQVFLKMKPLILTENNHPAISIIFGQDITHLIKGEQYWLRFTNGFNTFAYVHQKGKKEFKDLISESELKVLKLLAEKKSNAEIANELFLSKLTVETHRKNMIKRVGAVDSTALVHICKMSNII